MSQQAGSFQSAIGAIKVMFSLCSFVCRIVQ